MQNICYNSVMNRVRRQMMRPSRPRGKMKNASVSSASLRDENSSRTSRTSREIKTTTYIWDDWNTNGEVVAHYDYSPFGEPLVASGELVATFTHRFSTKPWCPVTGLYEYQMRKYRPEIGRWMSRDPIECAGMCKLLMEVPPPEKSGGHTTCEYDCGSFHYSIKIYGKCPDPGWYKLKGGW